MNSMRNKVQLIGNLGMDPELHTTQNGKAMDTVFTGYL